MSVGIGQGWGSFGKVGRLHYFWGFSLEMMVISKNVNDTKPQVLVVVVGATAVGKTDLSLYLGQQLGCEIVSSDARQCYQKMLIGTAKPTLAERQCVPHHLVDFLPLTAQYSAGQFERDAMGVLKQLWSKGRYALLAGGSGLYTAALCEGLDCVPAVPPEIQKMLYKRYQEEGLAPLLAALHGDDPLFYERVDGANPHRILRALGVCKATGLPYSSFLKGRRADRSFQLVKVGLRRPRAVLYDRINRRVDLMVRGGLLEEVASLLPYRGCRSLKTIGYQEIFRFLDGACSLEEAVRLVKRNTRRYAKRQLTWFRRDKEIAWFAPEDKEGVLSYVRRMTAVV